MQSYKMPPEWNQHKATWLSWPHNISNTWYEGLADIHQVFGLMISHLSQDEEVHIHVAGMDMENIARKAIAQFKLNESNIFFHYFPTNDSWVRDHGPIFVKNENNEKVILDWEYNAWGGKYPAEKDNLIPSLIGKYLNINTIKPNIILEGGSIDVNGAGVVLTTTSCLLNPNRNAKLTQKEIENYLKKYLGVNEVWWLGEGIAGDDTDGHIDDITRFVNAHTIVTTLESNPNDINYLALQHNYTLLQKYNEKRDSPFQIISLPMPDAVYYESERLPASYANFYIANKKVLVPTYACEKDKLALQILSDLFPQHQVIGIPFEKCILGLGSIHCLTQQEFS
jgi:agmatine deiminase